MYKRQLFAQHGADGLAQTADDVVLLGGDDLAALLCSLEAVSYTHLDVYKRQLVHIGRSLCEDVLSHDAHIGGTVLHIDGNIAGFDLSLIHI